MIEIEERDRRRGKVRAKEKACVPSGVHLRLRLLHQFLLVLAGQEVEVDDLVFEDLHVGLLALFKGLEGDDLFLAVCVRGEMNLRLLQR